MLAGVEAPAVPASAAGEMMDDELGWEGKAGARAAPAPGGRHPLGMLCCEERRQGSTLRPQHTSLQAPTFKDANVHPSASGVTLQPASLSL